MSATPFLRSPLLASLPGVRHGFFTRRGGVSTGIYQSLNVGQGSADDPSAILENRRLAAAALGAEESALATAYQIHSSIALVAEASWGADRPRGDAVVTTRPGLLCGALAADCAPVLIAEAQARVVAAVHAGWRGALAGVVEAAVACMERLGGRRERMVAAIGPCIAQSSYEVGLDLLDQFEAETVDAQRFFAPGRSSAKLQFDLPAFVGAQLEISGVTQHEWLERDTAAEDEMFFSNRRAYLRGEPDYGRLLSAIGLEEAICT